jgi:hypothetical protein
MSRVPVPSRTGRAHAHVRKQGFVAARTEVDKDRNGPVVDDDARVL